MGWHRRRPAQGVHPPFSRTCNRCSSMFPPNGAPSSSMNISLPSRPRRRDCQPSTSLRLSSLSPLRLSPIRSRWPLLNVCVYWPQPNGRPALNIRQRPKPNIVKVVSPDHYMINSEIRKLCYSVRIHASVCSNPTIDKFQGRVGLQKRIRKVVSRLAAVHPSHLAVWQECFFRWTEVSHQYWLFNTPPHDDGRDIMLPKSITNEVRA